MGMLPGYWSGPVFARETPILLHGRDSWMSITPLEIESQEIGIRLAHGRALIFGLGMGWAAAAMAANPAVSAVTIVERDPQCSRSIRRSILSRNFTPARAPSCG